MKDVLFWSLFAVAWAWVIFLGIGHFRFRRECKLIDEAKKYPKVVVVSEGPGTRTLSEIMNDPPKLELK